MGIDSIGARTSGSYGVVKADATAVADESEQVGAAEYNRFVDGVIALETAIGTTTAPAVGSAEARLQSLLARIVALETNPPVGLPVNTAPPAVMPVDSPQLEGAVLSYQAGTWTGADSVTHEWVVGGSPTGNSDPTFSTTGHLGQVTVREVASNAAGSAAPVDSAAIEIVPDVSLVVGPTVSGNFVVGDVVSIAPGTYTNAGPGRTYTAYVHGSIYAPWQDQTSNLIEQSMAGQEITFVEGVERLDGTYATFTVQPQDQTVVPYALAVPQVSPAGPVDVGDTLTVDSPAGFQGAISVGHHWEHESNPGGMVAGQGNYTTQPQDAGQSLVYVGVGSNAGGSTRSVSTPVPVASVTDFRTAAITPGAQASFRRFAAGEGAGEDSNVVKADGDTTIATIADGIVQGDKEFSQGPYLISAPSTTQRPLLGPNGTMAMEVARACLLRQTSSPLAALFGSEGAYTVYIVAPFASFTGAPFGSLSAALAAADSFGAYNPSGNNQRHLCRNAAGSGNVDGGGVAIEAVLTLVAADGQPVRTYADGVLANTAAVQSAICDILDVIQVGDYAPFPNADGPLCEVFACVAEHDGTQIATTSANLRTDWESRGVVFP